MQKRNLTWPYRSFRSFQKSAEDISKSPKLKSVHDTSGLAYSRTMDGWTSGQVASKYAILALIIFFNFYSYSSTVVCLFSPSLHPAPAEPTSLPHLHLPPWFCPSVLYSSSCELLSPLSPPHSPLAIVRLFLTSMSLVIFCLLFSFVDYVPVKGDCPLTQQFHCWDYTIRTLRH